MSDWVTTCNERPEWLSRDDPESETAHWCLILVWSAAEPERIGETAFLDGRGGEYILGRGGPTATDRGERLLFVRQRPGSLVPRPPLAGDGLSRRQCVVRATRDGLTVENVGRAPLLVSGKEERSARLGAGELVTIRDHLVLYCTKQAPLRRLQYFPVNRAREFGTADEFGMVGEHRASWELREQLAFAAASDRHVLLLGESGVGKELAANALHHLSRRSGRPIVARNAATFPPALIDAELFGNAANYPNVGMPARPGIVGLADGTTLFLDEIAELPTELQAHLLRVIDSAGEYQRLGDAQARRSDLRLIAATNRDPADLRLDILGRLTLQVQLPGLNDRIPDIPLLVRHLLMRAGASSPELRDRYFVATAQGTEPRVDPDLIEALMRHHYSYNVRELERLLWKALADSPKQFVALTRSVREELGTEVVRAPSVAE
ncbi:MAG TPA: sigma 54-interacting transcriptional regulator, partial [Polyangiaceae bacterium]